MENNKLVITIIFLFLIILSIFVIIFLYTSGYFENETTKIEQPLHQTHFYIKALDYENNDIIPLNYYLFEGQNIIKCLDSDQKKLILKNQTHFFELYIDLKEKNIDENGCYVEKIVPQLKEFGKLGAGLNLMNISPNHLNQIYFGDNNYYISREIWGEGSIKNDSIQEIKTMRKATDFQINYVGNLTSNNNNKQRVILQPNGWIKHINLCFEWTFGILDVSTDYRIADKPLRLSNADICYKTSENPRTNQTVFFDFDVKTHNLVESDKLNIYILDEELIYNDNELTWDYGIEDKNGVDIGIRDILITKTK